MNVASSLGGKVAVVTGSGRGIGRAIALAFGEWGSDVVVCARSESEVRATADEVRARGVRAVAAVVDVSDERQVDGLAQRTIRELGRVDILVNNVGVAIVKGFLESTPSDWSVQIGSNLMGTLFCTRAFGKYLVAQRSGRIINVSSITGIAGKKGMAVYGATKAAIIQFTRVLAIEWASFNINVNCIVPGAFHTRPMRGVLEDPSLGPLRVGKIPLRRAGDPAEVAPLAVYLASDASSFMTGAILPLDGGETAKL